MQMIEKEKRKQKKGNKNKTKNKNKKEKRCIYEGNRIHLTYEDTRA